jgi:hypothetical protein
MPVVFSCTVNTDTVLTVEPSILQYRCEMTNRCVKELVDFINKLFHCTVQRPLFSISKYRAK